MQPSPQSRPVTVAGPILALPNLLTLVRVPLGVAFWAAPADPVFAFSVLGAAGLSDLLDGWFARKVRAHRWKRGDVGAFAAGTGLGAWLDPLCDKIFVASVLLALVVRLEVALALVLLTGTRELLQLPAWLAYRAGILGLRERGGVDYTADWPGKVTTVLQFGTIAAALVPWVLVEELALASGGMGVVTAVYYVRRELRRGRAPLTDPGPGR